MDHTHGGNIWEAARRAGLSPREIVDFSASVNPAGPSPGARMALKKAARLIQSYPEPDAVELKKALSIYHDVSVKEVLPGNGSTELIYLIPQVLKPRKAIIVEPAFSEYRRSLELIGCKIDHFVLSEKNGFSLDIGLLKKALTRSRPDIVYLCNPANPAGVLTEKDAVLELARFCEKAGTTLVADEAFMDFCEAGSIKKEAARFKNLLVLRSMTKFFGIAGLRSGCLIAHKRVIEGFSKNIAPWSVNTLSQAASIASLKDAAYIRKTLSLVEREKRFLKAKLDAISAVKAFSSSANFLLLKIDSGTMDASKLKVKLFKKGILIRDLCDFRGLGPNYCRVAVRARRENSLLVSAFGEVFSK